MSIYSHVLGEKIEELHPMLQKRYKQLERQPYQGSGVMKKISGGPMWLAPLFWLGTKRKLLFPEKGTFIPFTIRHTPRTGENGEEQVHWERVFYFNGKKRYFNALMSLDENQSMIKDYLGEPPIVYSDLAFSVIEGGGIEIRSQRQRLVLGKLEIPLPKLLQGLATVRESYDDDRNVYTIHVNVRNPLVGRVFSYEGEFTQDV